MMVSDDPNKEKQAAVVTKGISFQNYFLDYAKKMRFVADRAPSNMLIFKKLLCQNVKYLQ